MKDIEVKRKELETAKWIRDNGYSCTDIDCKESECPCDPNPNRQDGCRGWNQHPKKWDAFISTREAELAALEKTPRLYIGKNGKMEYIMPIGPTIDDFALALIQGGFYQDLEADEETHAMPAECLFNAAASLKAESDRRREA